MGWGLGEGVVKVGRSRIQSTTIWRKPIRSMIRKILELTELSKCLVSWFFYTPVGVGSREGGSLGWGGQ